jgi:hypothetical protein
MKGERHIEIDSPNYTYTGKMTANELLRTATKHKLRADDVTIEGLVMYGWDEVDMMWAMTSEPSATIHFE